MIVQQPIRRKKTHIMKTWREFLDSLDTPGGVIVVLIFLLFFVMTIAKVLNFNREQDINMIIGALLMHLRSTISSFKKTPIEEKEKE